MRCSIWSLIALGLCAVTSTAIGPSPLGSQLEAGDGQLIPGSYLVELDEDETFEGFFKKLEAQGLQIKRSMEMDYKVFRGVSFRVLNKDKVGDTDTMLRVASQAQAKVKNAWPMQVLVPTGSDVHSSIPHYSPTKSRLRKRQVDDESGGHTPHVLTGIDKLHAAGYTGKGKRIAILDSGIDYEHPALGGCFGKGCKVSYGYDLVGDDYVPGMNDAVPDDDPYENVTSHGTAVAGIIGADKNEFGMLGAAPDAELGMFRIMADPERGSMMDIPIAALAMAYEAGSDVISVSYGTPSGWADHPMALVASRIVEQGVPVLAAPGNAGNGGLWHISSPASGEKVTAVGASTTGEVPFILIEGSWTANGGAPREYGWRTFGGAPEIESNTTLPIYALDDLTPGSRACEPLPDDTPDLSGQFVLVQWRACSPLTQVNNVQAKGAEYILMFSQQNMTFDVWLSPEYDSDELPRMAGVPPYYVAQWLDALEDGANVTVSVPGVKSDAAYFVDIAKAEVEAGAAREPSSWGPGWDLTLKPEMLAPGEDLLTTIPLVQGGWTVMSGTSFATPMVAGLVALLMEARGSSDAEEILGALMSQAKPVGYYDHSVNVREDILAPPAQQGSGIVQGWDSAHVTGSLSPSSLSFNDTENFKGKQTFTVYNGGDEDVTYSLSHVDASAMYNFGKTTIWPVTHPVGAVQGAASVKFSSDEVTLATGESTTITVTLSPPSGLDEDLLPVYGGFIQLQGSNNETLSLPYLGVAANMRDQQVIVSGEEGQTYLSRFPDISTPTEANETFQVERREAGSDLILDGDPTFWITTRVGTRLLRADVLALDSHNFTTTDFFGYEFIGSAMGFPREWLSGSLVIDEGDQVFYHAHIFFFSGELDDGTELPEGRYQVVLSALRIFGDAQNKEDWDFVELVPFNLEFV